MSSLSTKSTECEIKLSLISIILINRMVVVSIMKYFLKNLYTSCNSAIHMKKRHSYKTFKDSRITFSFLTKKNLSKFQNFFVDNRYLFFTVDKHMKRFENFHRNKFPLEEQFQCNIHTPPLCMEITL